MTLLDLKSGEKGIIAKVKGRGAFRKRIIEMGFVSGKTVEVIKKAPLRDPIEYKIMGYNVSLRASEAQLIEVVRLEDKDELRKVEYEGVIPGEKLKTLKEKGKTINVALVGNPNSGKTTFFNRASRSRERVGNYGGVTIDAKESYFKLDGYHFNIVDLPGTYSLTAYSPEELFVRKHITEELPDVVINIVDASNLERNLYLTTQLIDMDIKVVMALNMYDELERKGDEFDYELFGKLTGVPVVPTISTKGAGLRNVFRKVIDVYEDRDKTLRHVHINYGGYFEKALKNIQDKINAKGNQDLTDLVSSRFIALKLLEEDKAASKIITDYCHNHKEILEATYGYIQKLQNKYNEHPETTITDLKYGFINGALKETFRAGHIDKPRKSESIDRFFTNRYLGFPVFLLFMWAMFSITFVLGSYPMEWIESGIESLSVFLDNKMSDGPLKDLFINGIISGVGGVIVFLPNIMLLFFFISLMEDTGYMSRAAFIMDKLMHKMGLHGKSFIPLLMGFGCNVPAIMATRTIESRNDRMLTMLINPFMSCSARLPIYVLFISAFFTKYHGTILFSIYILGVIVAILVALIFKKLFFRSYEAPFVMELPPYRMPTLRTTTVHMWDKAVHYIKKISGVILVASIIIWALGYFPQGNNFHGNLREEKQNIIQDYENKIDALETADQAVIEKLTAEKDVKLEAIESSFYVERQEQSYIGRLGQAILPIMRPLGFDWKMSVSILSGVAAKEIVVSTLGVLYQADEAQQTKSPSLVEKLQTQTYDAGPNKGEKVFNPVVALAFMVFVLLYFPCIAVIVTISKEAGHWKWGLFTVLYTTIIAWVVSFMVYQLGSAIYL